MTKLLLNYFSFQLKQKRWLTSSFFPTLTKKVLFLSGTFFIFLWGNQSFGQQVDTWFSAGKGINSPTSPFWLYQPDPITTLGQDGDPVNTWYDIVYYSEQNLIPNPANPADYPNDPFLGVPPGFDYPFPNSGSYAQYLTPTGTIPGVPTVRRNPTDNLNFNPIVEFDGSGDGEALHFRSNSRGDVTVFVVFRAEGAGTSAETQRLLYGGDVDVHHESNNSNDWTTNLSLGVSDGNRFSVGRTWNPISMADSGNFFQTGNIDLLGEPTIGAFSRTRGGNSELLTTNVNGLRDIFINRNHPLADNTLFYFNRVGKHFNSNDSNRNLTGDIAEILLADFAMTDNQRQRVESYLAIKYGITLSNGAQLGSIVGNGTYDYLAADGTVIWQSDPTYQHDIAGLGKDRYKDVLNSLSLRYNLDQRISKSINSDAIVTMSTNSDFTTDNLDLSRTEIDGQISGGIDPYEHNYLIWANDDRSINEVFAELPTGIDSRIEREWRVQAVRTAANPIANISVRVDLSGSDILINNPGGCTIKLLIDTDLDGDFTTGAITEINASSIDMAGNAYFDNVTFNHREVFTIGFVDEIPDVFDLLDPTVCDSYTLPAITGTNLTGNEAYYDSPGGTGTQYAPGDVLTTSGTYYIYDETGTTPNCFDEESFVLTVNVTPDIDALADQTVCDSYTLPAITGTDLTGNQAYYDGPGGTGTQYAPGDVLTTSGTYYIYDESGTCFDEESFVLTVNVTPNIDPLANQTVCDSYTLPAITGIDLTGNEAYFDGPGGTGTQYAPGDVLTASGTYYIYDESGTCFDEESFVLTVNVTPDVLDLLDPTVCDSYTLPAITGTNLTGNEAYYDAPNGGGTQYAPGDVLTTSGTYYIYDETGTTPNCFDEESFVLTVNVTPNVSDLLDTESCDSFVLPPILGSNLSGNQAYYDGPGGTGTQYAPGDVLTTSGIYYIYDETGTVPNCFDEESFVLTITPSPVVDAGSDEEICQGDAHDFSTSSVLPSASNTSALLWQTAGDGSFSDPNVLLPIYTPGAGDIANGSVVLTLRGAGNGSCGPVNDSMTLTITPAPVVDAGSDEEICAGDVHDLSTSGTVPTASDAGSLLWSSTGDGSFDDATLLAPTYNPGVNDIANGSVVLTLTGTGNGSCPDAVDTMNLTITPSPVVDAGSDQTICEGDVMDLSTSVTQPSESNTAALLWTTAGDGSFSDPNILLPVYTPGAADILAGSVVLTLTGNGNGTCPLTFDSMTLTINDRPSIGVDLFSHPTTCAGSDGSITFIFTNVPNGNYDIVYDAGTFNAVPVNAGSAVVNGLPAGNYNNLSITVSGCTSTEDPDVTLTAPGSPDIDPLADQTVCDSYALPGITGTDLTGNEAYFDGPGGTGTQYAPGDVLTASGTYYIYDESGTCFDEESFVLTVNVTPDVFDLLDPTVCDSYTLPAITGTDMTGNQAYYDGPGGTGTQYAPGDVLTTSGTYYIYDETGTTPNCSDEESFVLTVNVTPDVDALADQTVCDSYTLPAITGTNLTGNEAYYDAPNGGGTQYAPGDVLTTSGTYYIYDETGTTPNCFDEESFVLTVNVTPNVSDLLDTESCDSFVLPPILGSNLSGNQAYYDGPGGTGTQYAPGDVLTTSGTYYIYDETGTAPNCFDEESFTITITDQPDAGTDGNINICEGTVLSDADLFAELGGTPDAGGTWSPLFAGAGVYTYTVAATAPCTNDATATVTVTEQPQPDAGTDGNINICEGTVLSDADLFAELGGTPDAGGTWSPLFAGAGVYTYTVAATAPCTNDATATVTVTEQPQPIADNPADVEVCDSYVLPELTNGNYFTGSNGTGTPLFEGDIITTSQTIYIFNTGGSACSNAEESFEVTITGFNVTTNVQHETCWESNDGSVSASIDNAVSPITVQLNNMEPMVFNTGSFSIEDLSPGNYEMNIIDDTGCQTNTSFNVEAGGPNLGGSVDVMYLCDADLPSNTIVVTLSNPSVSNDVLYALDSTDPDDFILSPDFGDVSSGNHSLFIMHNNGCMGEIPFEVENFDQLELSLSSEYVNQITANVTGGTAPYTYYFDNNGGTSTNTYTIDRSGTFIVRVVDNNGCEVTQSITMNLVDITIPDFFTPNNDGQNDYWSPRNTELFLDIETYIFDRYGRKIQILGPTDEWNGEYESKPMPSGDYWYIVKLNDGSGREFVGHFTLYR